MNEEVEAGITGLRSCGESETDVGLKTRYPPSQSWTLPSCPTPSPFLADPCGLLPVTRNDDK